MDLTYAKLYKFVEKNIKRAKGEKDLLETKDGMEIEFPGFSLSPCEFREGEFVTLFLDIRGSTARAKEIGGMKTFITLQALLPSLARIVKDLDGFVVDYPGDGIMAHWKANPFNEGLPIRNAVKAAGCMDDAINTLINPLLRKEGIPPLVCGIGVAHGPVILTCIGVPGAYSHKAIGDSVNKAAKLASNKEYPGSILIMAEAADKGFRESPESPLHKVAYVYDWISIDEYLDTKRITQNNLLRLPRPTQEDTDLERRAKFPGLLSNLLLSDFATPVSLRGRVAL